MLAGLLLPVMAKQIRKAGRMRCQSEAQMVCRAAALYLMDLEEEGIRRENWELAAEIGMPFSENPEHPLLAYMDGRPSEDGWIYSIYYNGTADSFEGILYETGGYRMEVLTGGRVTVLSGE